MPKKVTLREIANITGVSVSTVSKALNKSSEIPKSTQQRIVEVARSMHYQFNGMSGTRNENTADERGRMVGFLVPDVSNPYFARLWAGIEDIARLHNYSVVVCHTGENPKTEIEQIRKIQSLNVSGLLSVPVSESNYHNLDIPLVLLSRIDAACDSFSYVVNNDFRGAYLAAKYFLDQGKTNVFFLSGPGEISVAHNRTQGIKVAFQERNLTFLKSHIIYDNLKFEDGRKNLKEILKNNKTPIGLFCSSDIVAIGALDMARASGRKIPEEISIVGYDNIDNDRYLDYPLTTIAQADYQIGSHGMKTLLDLISEPETYRQVRQIMFEPEIIVRKT